MRRNPCFVSSRACIKQDTDKMKNYFQVVLDVKNGYKNEQLHNFEHVFQLPVGIFFKTS